MSKKSLTIREIILMVVGVLLILGFITWQMIIKPMQENGADIDDRLTAISLKLSEAKNIVNQGKKVDERLARLKELIGVSDSEGAEMSLLVSYIETAAKDANIHIANMKPSKARNEGGVSFYPVEVDVDGQWSDMVVFFRQIQSKPNYLFVDDLNLEKYSDATGSLRGRIVVTRMRLTSS